MSKLEIIQREFSDWQNYNYLVHDTEKKEGVVIDASDGCESFISEAENLGIKISKILLTHSHFDHIGALKNFLQKLPEIKICIHENEADKIDWVGSNLEILKDKQKIMVAKNEIVAWHTPGHTKGSICYVTENEIFTGDTVFIGGHGRTDLEGGDFDELKESFRKLRQLPDELVLYPGHAYADEKSTWEREKDNIKD